MLFQQLLFPTAQALISPYLYSANTGYSPRLELSESCGAFGSVLHEFEELWKLPAESALGWDAGRDRPRMVRALPAALRRAPALWR